MKAVTLDTAVTAAACTQSALGLPGQGLARFAKIASIEAQI